MNQLSKLFFGVFIVVCTTSVYCVSAQSRSSLNNNAKKVISIHERRFGARALTLLYDTANPFVEKKPFVDTRSALIIEIDREALGRFDDFTGSVSLSATLNNRQIEVSPYSEIGKELKTVGVSGVNSTRDFAMSLFNFIVQTSRFNTDIFCTFSSEYALILSEKPSLERESIYKVYEESQQFLTEKGKPTRYEDLINLIKQKYLYLYPVLSNSLPLDDQALLSEVNSIGIQSLNSYNKMTPHISVM